MIGYFKSSMLFTITAIVLGALYGHFIGAGVLWTTLVVLILGVLEISLSFDNAIVNAKVLNTMSEKWQHRFITWGMAIAVFGMRIFFPLLIVSIVGRVGLYNALMMAISEPQKYAEALTSAHISIAGFGGTFLLLVALKYFFNVEKDIHWIHNVENVLSKFGRLNSIEIIITLGSVALFSTFLHDSEQLTFIIASICGIVCHELIAGLSELLEEKGHRDMVKGVAKGGAMSFLYLEVLDASFSFDGVIGAFVISNNIFIIALGLGVGAMFVRSLTIMFVEKKTLTSFRYIENGAFWSILVLSIIMFASTITEVPEYVTGILSVVFILSSFISSLKYNKQNVSHLE